MNKQTFNEMVQTRWMTLREKIQKHWMILSVVAGIVLACILIAFQLLRNNASPISYTRTATRTNPYPTTDPSLITSSLSFTKYQNAVNVNIDTGSDSISGVQLKIAYDPKVLTNVKVVPGSFFPNGTVLQNDVDAQNGIINYAFAINPGMKQLKGKGQIISISYIAVPQTATDMVFMPNTKITSEGITASVLKNTATITVP